MHYNYSFRFKSLKKECIWRTEQSPENCIYIYWYTNGIPTYIYLHRSSPIFKYLDSSAKHIKTLHPHDSSDG